MRANRCRIIFKPSCGAMRDSLLGHTATETLAKLINN